MKNVIYLTRIFFIIFCFSFVALISVSLALLAWKVITIGGFLVCTLASLLLGYMAVALIESVVVDIKKNEMRICGYIYADYIANAAILTESSEYFIDKIEEEGHGLIIKTMFGKYYFFNTNEKYFVEKIKEAVRTAETIDIFLDEYQYDL